MAVSLLIPREPFIVHEIALYFQSPNQSGPSKKIQSRLSQNIVRARRPSPFRALPPKRGRKISSRFDQVEFLFIVHDAISIKLIAQLWQSKQFSADKLLDAVATNTLQ